MRDAAEWSEAVQRKRILEVRYIDSRDVDLCRDKGEINLGMGSQERLTWSRSKQTLAPLTSELMKVVLADSMSRHVFAMQRRALFSFAFSTSGTVAMPIKHRRFTGDERTAATSGDLPRSLSFGSAACVAPKDDE